VVKVPEDFSLSDFGDIIHGLACVIADTGILVREAGKYWWHNDLQISR
jgi:hypothetical protein